MIPNTFENPGFFREVIEGLPIGVYILDREQHIRFWNSTAERIIGHLAYEVVGRKCTEHIVKACDLRGNPVCGDHCPIVSVLKDGQPQEFAAFYLHKHGHRVPVTVRARALFQNGDVIIGAVVLFEGTIEAQDKTPMYGCLDRITGVPSHRLTRAVLREWINGMEETRHGFGVLRIRVLGLDEFRSKHGPHSALPFMRTTAQSLRHSLEPENFLGRWGEDEFIAVLPSANPVAAAAVAEMLWSVITHSEVIWWGDCFPVQAVVMHTVAQPGDKMEKLLNGLEPAHAAAAGRAVGAVTGA